MTYENWNRFLVLLVRKTLGRKKRPWLTFSRIYVEHWLPERRSSGTDFKVNENVYLGNLHYARWVTPKRVTSLPPNLCVTTLRQHSFFRKMSQRWLVVGKTESDLTDPRFEPQISRSRDESITAWPTGRSVVFLILIIILFETKMFARTFSEIYKLNQR